MDPAILLSPTSHHHPMNTMTGTTSTRTPYFSSRCHRWEISRRREPGESIVYDADCTAQGMHVVRQSRTAQCGKVLAAVIWLRDSISRARSCTWRPALKSRRKGTKKSKITRLPLFSALLQSFLYFPVVNVILSTCCVNGYLARAHLFR